MTLLNEAQKEQLKEITQYLLQVRQEKSIRIEAIAATTNIRLTFLQALDAGQFAELPEPVYVQGFIRRYGDAIGLDGTALANTFIINDVPQDFNHDSQILDKRPDIHIPLFVPYVLLLVLASVGLIYVLNPKLTAESLAKKQNSVSTQEAKITPLPVPSSPEPESLATPETIALPVTSPKPTASENIEVSLELQGKSWLQVTVDGKTEFMGNLTKGEQRTWTAKEQLTIRSGNAGAVLISVNQQPAEPFGSDGDVKEVTFSPESISQ
ncbi:helix-turn-helix domain-containing protein [Nostocales cyanobacterium LEGE 11386]|nr:helix-turn-helix domain-containing protein [Nostocales cyanobacterium LEGE 11386]